MAVEVRVYSAPKIGGTDQTFEGALQPPPDIPGPYEVMYTAEGSLLRVTDAALQAILESRPDITRIA